MEPITVGYRHQQPLTVVAAECTRQSLLDERPTPNGIDWSAPQYLQINQLFFRSFKNDGGAVADVINWYFTGSYPAGSTSSALTDEGKRIGGAFWAETIQDADMAQFIASQTGLTEAKHLTAALNQAFASD